MTADTAATYQVTVEFVDGVRQTHVIPENESVAGVVAAARDTYGVDVENYWVTKVQLNDGTES